MENFETIGRWIIIFGIAVIVIGGVIWLLGKLGINQLPGTLRLEGPGVTCIFPVLASIVLSILLTLILNLLARFFNH